MVQESEMMRKKRWKSEDGGKDGGNGRLLQADLQRRSRRESNYTHMVEWSQQVNVEGLVLQGKLWPLVWSHTQC